MSGAFRRFGPESPFDDPFGHMRATARSFLGHTTRKPVVGRKTKGASTTRVPPPFFLQLRSFVRLPGISPAGKPSPAAPFAASIAGQRPRRIHGVVEPVPLEGDFGGRADRSGAPNARLSQGRGHRRSAR